MSKRGKGRHASVKRRKPDFRSGLGGGAVLIGTAAMLVSSPTADTAQAAPLHSDQASAFKTPASSLAQAGAQGAPWGGTCGPVGPQGPQGGSGQGQGNWCSTQGFQGTPMPQFPGVPVGTKGVPPCTPPPIQIKGAQGFQCGPQGPPGKTGPTGPTGPRGYPGHRGKTRPTGPAGTASTSVWTRLHYIHGGTNTDSVNCPYGTTATGGGYAFGGRIADNPPALISSRPSGGSMSSGPTDWTISFRQGRVGTSGDVRVYAVCTG